ncbi:MAG: hypothetical protein FJZ58_00585 [Chlamydiae bacterium]|nr:hypothetical protein [Chlamydiota bacterium]
MSSIFGRSISRQQESQESVEEQVARKNQSLSLREKLLPPAEGPLHKTEAEVKTSKPYDPPKVSEDKKKMDSIEGGEASSVRVGKENKTPLNLGKDAVGTSRELLIPMKGNLDGEDAVIHGKEEEWVREGSPKTHSKEQPVNFLNLKNVDQTILEKDLRKKNEVDGQ